MRETHTRHTRNAATACAWAMALAALVSAVLLLSGCGIGQTVSLSASSAAESSNSKASEKTPSSSSATKSSSTSSSSKKEKPNRDLLDEILGKETADKLIKNAKTDDDAAWIAAHPDAYAVFRPHIQEKALRLAAEEPLAAAFVRGLPDKFPNDDIADEEAPAMDTASPSKKVPDTAFPHLYQWDLRWGYTMYDGDAFGLGGCGPAAMAMVYQGLTGKHDKTPYYMGQLAFAGGFVEYNYEGTQDGYFDYAADKLHLNNWDVEVSVEGINATLKEGHPLIAHMGPGMFSFVGHYIVLTGTTKDGKIIVNDPYSTERSSKVWDADLIASEAVALYAFCLPD